MSPSLRLRAGIGVPLIWPVGIVLAMAALFEPPVLAAEGSPEETVIAFYRHIARHECQAAAALAEGYGAERCEAIDTLRLCSPVLRKPQEPSRPDRAVLSFRIQFTRKDAADKPHCNTVEALSLIGPEPWKIQWASLKAETCAVSQECEEETGRRVRREPPAAVESPVSGPPASAAPRPVAAGAGDLLQLWSPGELAGRPGDERIIPLRPPDLDPPAVREPKVVLPQVEGPLANSIRRIRLPAGKNLVALTFDLCEQADDRTGYDRGVVNFLREQRIPATFFAGGKWLRSHEDKALQLMADPRFEIGNHGWTHGNLRVLRGQKLREQILWTQAEYGRIWDILDRKAKAQGLAKAMAAIPPQPSSLRFPYGTCDGEALKATNELGLHAIQWDVVSGDAVPSAAPESLVRTVLRGVRPGSIVVFHANGRGHGTAEVLPAIVTALRAKGYEFLTVSGLLREGVPETAGQCYEMRPGDNLYIDAKFGEGTGEK